MSLATSYSNSSRSHLGSSARRRFFEILATVGYAAKGVVYLAVGGLATLAALEPSQSAEGSRGALSQILELPWGRALLIAVTVGLAAYVGWRFIQATLDPEGKSDDLQGAALRVYYGVSALAYATLTVFAARLVAGSMSSDSGSNQLLSQLDSPWQRIAYGIAAAGLLAGAAYGAWRAVTCSFTETLSFDDVSAPAREWLVRISRIGLGARSLVFVVLAVSFGAAAVRGSRPDDTSTEGALSTIAESGGSWALLAVALGLLAYSLHQFVKSRYRKIEAG